MKANGVGVSASVETRIATTASEKSSAPASRRGIASVAAALSLVMYALHVPSRNWLLEYHANPALAGTPQARAWIRSANFEVPGELLLAGVPDREAFSVRLQSCLPVSEPSTLEVRLRADDRARFYVDGELELDSAETEADASKRGKRKREHTPGEVEVELKAGVHRISLEYTNWSGPGSLRLGISQRGMTDEMLQSRLRRPSLDGQCGAS
jgi:hypothetical protein